MASPPTTLARRSTVALLPAITRLAWWRLKQMWRILLVTWLGMISMVVLVCSVPLFTQVSSTSGLRNALSNVPPSQQRVTASFFSNQPTSGDIAQVQQQINQAVQSNLGSYINGASHFSVSIPPLTLPTSSAHAGSSQKPNLLRVTGYELDKLGNELTVVQGRLPTLTSSQVEIALTQAEASALKVGVGSVLTASFPAYAGSGSWTLHVVGIIALNQNWEYDNNFQSQLTPDGTAYPILASSATLLPQISSMQISVSDRQSFGKTAKAGVVAGSGPFFRLTWNYPFDISRVDANNLDALSQSVDNLSSQLDSVLGQSPGASFLQNGPQGAVFDVLSNYSLDMKIATVPITALLVLILALVLFLVGTMSVALVERQTATIATLRSRGATRRHVFGAFVTQGLILGLLALLLGPFVALFLVNWLVHLLLPAAQSSLNVLTNSPLLEVLSVGWFALAAVACVVLTLILAIRNATKLDVLAFRRESARATRKPFWRRLNLDIVGLVLLALGYFAHFYLSQPVLADQLGSGLLALQGFLALLAPFLATLIFFTLFLRLYPLALRLGSRLAARRPKAPAVLAFAQMERAPRPASRMILLLALVISTTMFLLTYTATQQQRTIDSANFAVGADFSGQSAPNPHHLSVAQQEAAYRATSGVIAASTGYETTIAGQATTTATDIVAVDTATYATTALWTSQYSDQSLSSLMSLLTAHSSDVADNDTVPAIIDDSMAKGKGLAVGDSFLQAAIDGYNMHFIVVAQIHAIPTVYDGSYRFNTYGLLCSYQDYAAVYAKNSGNTLDTNMVWLKTKSDPASLSSVRHTYPALLDRRAMITSDESNPLYVNVTGVLYLGIATALLLALLGTLFFAWMNAEGRLTNFAVLRALGMAPRQIAAVLLWEQGGIYVAGLVLGVALGLYLLTLVGPALVFTDVVTAIGAQTDTYILPAQTVSPIWLIVGLLGVLVVICGVALVLMTRLIARPSLGQVLRLNED